MDRNHEPGSDLDKGSEKVIYTGLFLDDQGRETALQQVQPKFDNVIAHHITLKFKPNDGVAGIEVGRVSRVKLVGQVIDSEIGIQACLAELPDGVASTNDHPHITWTTRNGVPPVKSNDAIKKAVMDGTVVKFDKPIEIEVREGYFTGVQVVTSK